MRVVKRGVVDRTLILYIVKEGRSSMQRWSPERPMLDAKASIGQWRRIVRARLFGSMRFDWHFRQCSTAPQPGSCRGT